MDGSPLNLIISIVYYVVVGVLTLFSLFTVYILLRYGKSQVVALGASILFIFVYLGVLSASYATLNKILH